ncbi:hypothetical protein TEA_028615 [Camellia sinensis var. sinensis]|uniref:Potassium channel n=1 Tax=Camellia sinensis var. sinensis TaxID=542762 RepID=A0A4S4DH29_CAMSN|nr:hypothetical protein TEA_028615 [Camellia sinensis var. sinensis]
MKMKKRRRRHEETKKKKKKKMKNTHRRTSSGCVAVAVAGGLRSEQMLLSLKKKKKKMTKKTSTILFAVAEVNRCKEGTRPSLSQFVNCFSQDEAPGYFRILPDLIVNYNIAICVNQACGNKEEVRYLLWIRLSRVRKVIDFFQNMEKDIRINYQFTRIVKLIAVELYCTHTAACIFYYLATTLPAEQEGYTWIGSLKMGDYSYSHFRQIDLWTRYTTSLYFAIVTMATVGEFISLLLEENRGLARVLKAAARGVVRGSSGRWWALQWPEITGGGEEEVKASLERERPQEYWSPSKLLDRWLVLLNSARSDPGRNGVVLARRQPSRRSHDLSCQSSYGDIHAVNLREMIFIMIYVSFDMILGAYLIGNMTALIVKGSKTERFRDKMADLMKYMNRNRLGRDIRNQIKGHLRLQYESSYTETSVLQDMPISIRAKISQTLYKPYVENVPLFKGCSTEFINQISTTTAPPLTVVLPYTTVSVVFIYIVAVKDLKRGFVASNSKDDPAKEAANFTSQVIRVHEEFFLPGEVIMEQGNVVDQLYFVCHGMLEEVGIGADGSEETVSNLEPNHLFGEISILCNIPQPYTVRVCELCRLLRLDKQSFSNILDIYFHDGRRILINLLEGKESNVRVKQLESDITFHIGKQEAELALRVNSAAYHGDLHQLKSLIRAEADPKKTDYDGRSPLHLAASRGYEDITLFLIQEGVDVNISDKFGNTPLLEALKNGHDRVASILVKEGAALKIDDAGSFLCTVVTNGDSDFLKRILSNGIDPNSKDYDHRTPLHVAASEGLYLTAKLLLEAGANKFGNTPLLEALKNGHDRVASILVKEGAALKIDDAGSFLCTVVTNGDSDFLKRILSNGIDPNSKDYDHRTPLHVAASEGLYLTAKLLLEAGASVFLKDRWGNSPLDEAQICGNKNLIKLLKDAKSTQLPEFPNYSQEITDRVNLRKCTVFPFHPWDPKDKRKYGIVLWIPQTIEELIKTAAKQLDLPRGSCILSEDADKFQSNPPPFLPTTRETQSFLERENEDDRNNTPFSFETIRRRREYKKLRILMNRSMVRSLPQLELREKTICPGCTIYKWTRAQTDEDGVEGGANQKLQPPLNRKLQLLSL